MANFQSILEHIAIYVVTFLAKLGFEFLGPLIVVGPYGMRLAFNEYVLREASFRLIEDNPTLVNQRSRIRPFFERFIAVRNPVAMYLEGICYVARSGDYTEAIQLLSYRWSYLFGTCHPSASMTFTLSLLMLCVHGTDDARLQRAFSHDAKVDLVAQRVFNDIIAVAGLRRRPLERLKRKISSVCFFAINVCGEQSVRHVTLGGGHKSLRTCSWHPRVNMFPSPVLVYYA